jgi:AmmeMemoRadiSam system protein B
MVREVALVRQDPLGCAIARRYNVAMGSSVREPVVAGSFYPGDSGRLRALVEEFLGEPAPKRVPSSAGLIVPHAGYVYSGRVAGAGFRAASAFGRPDVILVLGASHSGLGGASALPTDGTWRTPLGDVPLASDLMEALAAAGIRRDASAFRREHSIEVQLPFLQVLFRDPVPVIPVCVQLAAFPLLATSAGAVSKVLGDSRVWVVASSDFTHYEPDAVARRLDRSALDFILAGDAEGFHREAVERALSICGAGAIVVLLLIARSLGLTCSSLIEYATSGDATGDRAAVVGYASTLFSKESL